MADLTQEQMAIAAAFQLKLVGLRINAKLSSIEPGPVVTAYKYKLDHSVPIAKIISKSEDFALAAGCEKVSIQRIGGEIVIFAANKVRQLVDFKDYLTWFMTAPEVANMALPVGIGVDYLGKKQAIDLQDMTHILLAGETGSGKSVFQSALICCLCTMKAAGSLRLYLVDTKQVDLTLFDKLPHVDGVITKLDEFHKKADWILKEIYRRMERFRGCSVRNIKEYHKLMGEDSLPYIVMVIDEFGDLLEQDKQARREDKTNEKEDREYDEIPPVDKWLQRIVQISRAAGIHIIAGTQRTSVKIISGDIKANFPCRISLRLPTGFDSRTILGVEGAENLLGKGDMLIQKPDAEVLQRYHGPFVNLNDIAWIISENQHVRDMYKSVREMQAMNDK